MNDNEIKSNQFVGSGTSQVSSGGNGIASGSTNQSQFIGAGASQVSSGNNGGMASSHGLNTMNENKDTNNNMKKIIIGVVAVAILLVIVFLFKGNGHKNTTGILDYSNSDVDLNCAIELSNDDYVSKIYSDFLFNHKSGDVNYQLKLYSKMIMEFDGGVTDEEYLKYIKSIGSVICMGKEEECAKSSHLELGIASLGWDIVVDRRENEIEVTYYNIYGAGQVSNRGDIKNFKATFEKEGYSCK